MNLRKSFLAIAAMICVVLGGASCSSTPDPGSRSTASAASTVHPGALVGTWVLDDTFDSPEQPYISFVQDNSWSASDGCNRVQGTWDLAADGTLTTTAGPQTMMACEGAQLPVAVSTVSSVEVDGDSMILHSSHDATVTSLIRSTSPTVGPQGYPIGYWTESKTSTSPFLSIRADRTYSGSDGCNTLTGTWSSPGDGSIALTQGAMTLMACADVDQWLSQAATGRVQAGVMTIQAADGTVLGQLSSL